MVSYSAQLLLSPGQALVARRDHAVLFVPQASEDQAAPLLKCFGSADDGRELDALAAFLVSNDLASVAFAAVEFSAAVTVMVFGDVNVTTDNRALPLINGQGSKSWVKNEVWGDPATITVAVGEADFVAATDLAAGVALAGGLSLRLTQSRSVREPETTTEPEPVVAPEPIAAPEPVAVPAPLAVVAPEPEPVPQPVARDVPTPEPPAVDLNPKPLSDFAPPFPDEDKDPAAEETFLPDPNQIDSVVDDVTSDAAGGDIRALAVFDDGSAEILDHSLLLGRNPKADTDPSRAGHRPVELNGEKLSRIHAEVLVEDGSITIVDCGSTNGTVVVPMPSVAPIKLVPGEPAALHVGSVVYLGSRTFRIDPLQ